MYTQYSYFLNDFKHETSTPERPQGHSEAEAFMKPQGKPVTTGHAENRNWVQELSRFLFIELSNYPTFINEHPAGSTSI